MLDKPDITDGGDNAKTIVTAELEAFFARIERMEDEKELASKTVKDIAADIKDEWSAMKSSGHDITTLKRVYAARKWTPDERALFHTYAERLKMFD